MIHLPFLADNNPFPIFLTNMLPDGSSLDGLRAALNGGGLNALAAPSAEAEGNKKAAGEEATEGIIEPHTLKPKRFNHMNKGPVDLAAVPAMDHRMKFIAEKEERKGAKDDEEEEEDDVDMEGKGYGKAERRSRARRRAARRAPPS